MAHHNIKSYILEVKLDSVKYVSMNRYIVT